MWTKAVIFLVTVTSINGFVRFQLAKIGKAVKLNLGSDVVTWKRQRKGHEEEFIKYCGPTEKGPRCAQFVNADDKPVPPKTIAHVEKNGTLIIESLKATDAGMYSSPDQKPIIMNHPDGSQSSTLRGHIQLVPDLKVINAMLLTIILVSAVVVSNQAATTKSVPLCGRCLPRTVILVPANGTGTITPVLRVLTNDSRGCRRMYIICNTPPGYTKSNMIMNEETNYPLIGKNVRALATCFKASWHAELGGSYIWLSSVRCFAT